MTGKTSWQIKKLGDVCDFYNGLWQGKEPPYIKVGVIRKYKTSQRMVNWMILILPILMLKKTI